jgi:hypothetical protein
MEQAAENLDLQLRASALQLAVSVVSKDSQYNPAEIMSLAAHFYKFLKGA